MPQRPEIQVLNRTLNRSCVPALIMCYLSKMLPVLASQLISQALNRIYFPADVSGAQHSATYYVYFEPASSNHNPSPRQQKSNGRPEFNKLNDQLACVKLPLNEEKLKSLSSATQSTPPNQPSSSNSEHLSPLRALLISEEQLAKYHYDGVIYILPLDVIFALSHGTKESRYP